MKLRYLGILLIFFSFLFLAACNSNSGGGSSSVPVDGDWLGTFHDVYLSNHYSLEVNVDKNDNITQLKISGSSMSYGGTVKPLSGYPSLYSFQLTDDPTNPSWGGFLVDSSGTHLAFYNEATGDFGVLQKGAQLIPIWSLQDLTGTWSGYEVILDTNGNVVSKGTSSVTVVNDGGPDYSSYSGTDAKGNHISGLLYNGSGWNDFYGEDDTGTSLIYVFLSPDKKFAASYSCIYGYNAVYYNNDYCAFNSWTRQ